MLTLTASSLALAQGANVTPPAALSLENILAIPAGIAAEVNKYTEFKPTGFSDWHPTRMEMLVSHRQHHADLSSRQTGRSAGIPD